MANTKKTQSKVIIEGKIFGVLAYLSILCIIPLLFKKDNSFALFHGKQGLVIFLGEVAIFILHILFEFIFRPGMFIFGVLSFIGIVNVLMGKKVSFPVISDIADNITL